MRNISCVIGEINEEVDELLNQYIVENRNFDVIGKAKKPTALLDLIRIHKPHLVFLSIDLRDEEMTAYEVCRQILGEFPSTIVIMTSLYERSSDLRESMKAGARDFIAIQDFEERLVSTALELVSSVRKYEVAASDRKGKVISFLSPKGGVGKSTLVFNLACELASNVNSEGSINKVLILDYDLQFGDIAYLGNVKSQRTVADLNDMASIDSDALQAHLSEHEKYGFWVLTAPKTPQYADIIRRETLEQTIVLAKRLFDYIIIDTPQGFDNATMVSIDQSDLVTVVSSGLMVDMKNLKSMLSTLDQLVDENFPKERISILLNQYTKNCIPEKEVANRFNFKILGTIPRNENVVANANNYNKSIVKDFATTDVAKSLRSTSNEITKILNPLEDNSKKGKAEAPKKKGLLSALFGK